MALWNKVWDWSVAQMTALEGAPVAAIACVAVGFIIAFFVLRYLYGERLTTKEERLKQARELAEDYKNKLHGATPDEAANAIKDLQARVAAIEPRRLTVQQAQTIAGALKPYKPRPVRIMHDGACADGNAYASQFAHVFGQLGWNVRFSIVIGPSMRPLHGLGIGVKNTSNVPQSAGTFADGLKAANIPFDVYTTGTPFDVYVDQQVGEEFDILITAPIRL